MSSSYGDGELSLPISEIMQGGIFYGNDYGMNQRRHALLWW